MRTSLTLLVLVSMLTAPVAAEPPRPSEVDTQAPAPVAGEPSGTEDGEVRPTLADRIAFVVADVLAGVQRLDRALVSLAEQARYAEIEISEPDYPGVGEDAVRIAAAITDRPVGTILGTDEAEALVERARDAIAPTLALAGVPETELTRASLAAAAERLGVTLGEAPFDATVLAQLQAISDDRLVPALQALGRDPGQRVSRDDLAPALASLGLDAGQLTAEALARLVAEARFRLAPIAYATGIEHDRLITRAGVTQALTRLGVRFGARVDAADVEAAVRAAGTRLNRSAPRTLGGTLTHRRLYLPTPDGPVAGHLLRWHAGPGGGVELDAGYAGTARARAPITGAAARRPDAAAVVNGGYWAIGGDPDGLLISDGHLLSSPETLRDWVRGVRTGFGLARDGRAVVAPPEVTVAVDLPGDRRLAVDGVNRPVGPDEAVLHTTGTHLGDLPSDAVTVVVPRPASLLRPSSSRFRLERSRQRSQPPPERLLLVARGRAAAELEAAAGREAVLQVEVGTAWQDVDSGLSGGPWLLRDGRVPEVEEWRTEGFGAGHTDRRHPRTAIGFDDAGNAMVLTVDGRQPGYSVGLTHRQTGELMAAFGARHAVMLDGGGSSQMVVDGELVNRPCCDRRLRPVATALYLTPR